MPPTGTRLASAILAGCLLGCGASRPDPFQDLAQEARDLSREVGQVAGGRVEQPLRHVTTACPPEGQESGLVHPGFSFVIEAPSNPRAMEEVAELLVERGWERGERVFTKRHPRYGHEMWLDLRVAEDRTAHSSENAGGGLLVFAQMDDACT